MPTAPAPTSCRWRAERCSGGCTDAPDSTHDRWAALARSKFTGVSNDDLSHPARPWPVPRRSRAAAIEDQGNKSGKSPGSLANSSGNMRACSHLANPSGFTPMPIALALNIIAGTVIDAANCMPKSSCDRDFAEQRAAALRALGLDAAEAKGQTHDWSRPHPVVQRPARRPLCVAVHGCEDDGFDVSLSSSVVTRTSPVNPSPSAMMLLSSPAASPAVL